MEEVIFFNLAKIIWIGSGFWKDALIILHVVVNTHDAGPGMIGLINYIKSSEANE